ncbi:MAG TPA: hypothetical protein VF590_06355 [Isosphaeraceae bacterium]
MDDLPPSKVRPLARHSAGQIVIVSATMLALGVTLRASSQFGANDISRWCTVWSLLERGTYAIDDCPWQKQTQDKVRRAAPFRLVVAGQPPLEHFYSSKPPLLPTLIAGLLYPARALSGVPLEYSEDQPRVERFVDKEVEGRTERVLETPQEPVKWPAHVFYFKPIVVLLNVVPFAVLLVLYARLLDRLDLGDWSWLASLAAAAWGTYLLAFNQTLNNHTIAAYSAFFALYPLVRIGDDGRAEGWRFAVAGLFGAFCACNELPAALFGMALFLMLLVRHPRQTLLWFVPAAAVPCAAFLATQYLAFGQFRPVYEEFGTKSYEYYGSYWNTPLEMDWYNKNPEPYAVYLFHMTFGHHGVFSLTPIFLFSIHGALRNLGRDGRLRAVAWLTTVLTAVMVAFYTWNPKARNYGGSTQGLRWLFWLIPFWLILLPEGLRPGEDRPWFRRLALAALGVSVLSVGYALRSPWSHPWILDLMEHLDLLTLTR